MGLYALFTKVPYTFSRLVYGIGGDSVASEYESTGVFQERSGMSQFDNIETPTSDAVLWIAPNEAFVELLNAQMVGNGVTVEGVNYRVVGQVTGKDHDLGIIDNYRLELKKENFAEWEASELPLE